MGDVVVELPSRRRQEQAPNRRLTFGPETTILERIRLCEESLGGGWVERIHARSYSYVDAFALCQRCDFCSIRAHDASTRESIIYNFTTVLHVVRLSSTAQFLSSMLVNNQEGSPSFLVHSTQHNPISSMLLVSVRSRRPSNRINSTLLRVPARESSQSAAFTAQTTKPAVESSQNEIAVALETQEEHLTSLDHR